MASEAISTRDTIAAPFVAQTTGRWDGDDGYWSTFTISVGTPPQSFRVLPATIDPHVSIITDDGCKAGMASVSNCGDLRGVNYVNGAASRGFQWSASGSSTSSTYRYFNAFDEFTGQSQFNASGPFGNDTLSLSSKGGFTNITMTNQIIAGVSDVNFWLGTFGLGNAYTNYAQSGFVAPSLLYNMKNQSQIPSISYGYTAGRYYDNKTEASLILGGYDTNRITGQNVTNKISSSDSTQSLNINVQSLTAQGLSSGNSLSLLNAATTASIDSSLTHLYLPSRACDLLASNLGLSYDNTTNYYTVNQTVHDTLKANNATLTFLLGGNSAPLSISMPYKSLDLQVGIPYYQPNQNYFPIRKAANDSQIVLGRAFLQETYLVVDWERSSFTVGPVNKATTAQNIVAITTPSSTPTIATVTPSSTATSAAEQPSSSGGIGAGAIAGIVIAVVLIAALGGLFFWWRKRSRDNRGRPSSWRKTWRKSEPPPYSASATDNGANAAEYYGGDKPEEAMAETDNKAPHAHFSELFDSSKPAELTSDNVRRHQDSPHGELMSTPVAELVGDTAGSELDSTSNPRASVASGSHTRVSSINSPQPATSVRSPLSPMFELE
ncbi:hypothetical protein AMS68_001839 [Peltaster fructicola]|uniref:Peptidase A1 domain-containing protein n=1 Tax=Peltaster fructicola TaxID=286661 RepID=A0A6H0XNI7_9PEZI|nr:hypothetical protein AMS68_001839 [Peltaster fructicola]